MGVAVLIRNKYKLHKKSLANLYKITIDIYPEMQYNNTINQGGIIYVYHLQSRALHHCGHCHRQYWHLDVPHLPPSLREVFCCPKIVKNLTISLTQETSRNDTHGTVDTFTHAGARTTKRGQAERQGTGRASQRASERENNTQHNTMMNTLLIH